MTDNSLARPTGRLAGQPAARVAPLPKPKTGGSRKITRRLVALSSAAVLAVYAVGYLQTDPAAQQIAAQEVAPSAVTGVPATATPLSQMVRNAVAAATATTSTAAPTDTSASSTVAAATSTAAPTDTSASSAVAASAPVATPATVPATSTPRPAIPTPRPAIPTPRAVATAVRPTASPTPTVVVTARYKDGSYVGQGYSRHGDIQATVIVKGGQIVSANVTACSTRYPCDVIDPMVGEVIQLQGPPVDGISRATDSSMAYYGAVQQALAKAG
jgi:uncharacterized protein with FMN-binding domain